MKSWFRYVKIHVLLLYVVMTFVCTIAYMTFLTDDDFHWFTPGTKTFVDYLYFSSTTMSTIGYGDIVPKTTRARVLVMVQQLIAVCILSMLLMK